MNIKLPLLNIFLNIKLQLLIKKVLFNMPKIVKLRFKNYLSMKNMKSKILSLQAKRIEQIPKLVSIKTVN